MARADYDRDGFVDLFVARYVHLDINKLREFGSNEKFCRDKGILVQCGPWGMEGENDLLYDNRGDGTFEEVASSLKVVSSNLTPATKNLLFQQRPRDLQPSELYPCDPGAIRGRRPGGGLQTRTPRPPNS